MKLVKEWQVKKRHYETQIDQISRDSQEKDKVLGRLEGELEQIRDRLAELCEAFKEKERECDQLRLESQDIRGQTESQENELLRLKDKSSK